MADSKETLRAKFLQTGALLTGTNKNGVHYSNVTQSDEFAAIRPQVKPQTAATEYADKQKAALLETEKQRIADEQKYKIAAEQKYIEEKKIAESWEKLKPGKGLIDIVGDAVDDVVSAVFPHKILEEQQQKIKENALEIEKQKILNEHRHKITAELKIEKQKILDEHRRKIGAELETEKQKILDEYRYKIAAEQRQTEEKQKAEVLKKQKSAKNSSFITKFFKVIGFIAIIAFLFVLISGGHNSIWQELVSIVLTYKVTT